MQKTLTAFATLYVVTLFVFAWLFFSTPPREIVREVTRETATEQTDQEPQDATSPPPSQTPPEAGQNKTELNWDNLPAIASESDILKSLGPVQVKTSINEVIAKILSGGEAHDSIIAALQKGGIPMSPDARSTLSFSIQGIWDESQQILTYRMTLALSQTTLMHRPEGSIRVPADIWQRGSYGFVGKQVARETVVNEAVRLADLFSESYVNANPPPPPP